MHVQTVIILGGKFLLVVILRWKHVKNEAFQHGKKVLNDEKYIDVSSQRSSRLKWKVSGVETSTYFFKPRQKNTVQ